MANKKAYVVFEGFRTGVFYNWPETEAAVKGAKGAKYKGYETEQEANEAWASYQANGKVTDVSQQTQNEETVANSKITEEVVKMNKEFDLLIYADGSANFTINTEDDYWGRDISERYASYGAVIISNKNKKYYIESGILRDTKEKEFTVERFDVEGERFALDSYNYEDVYNDDPKVENRRNLRRHTIVGAGYSDTAELEGVRRIVDIANKIGKDQRVLLVHDYKETPTMYNGSYEVKKNGAYYYGKRFDELRAGVININFQKVDSHVDAAKNVIVHAALNDCTDILAKAETADRPIGGAATHKGKSERVNGNAEWALERKIAPGEFKCEITDRKMKARALTKEVVAKLYPDYELVNSISGLI